MKTINKESFYFKKNKILLFLISLVLVAFLGSGFVGISTDIGMISPYRALSMLAPILLLFFVKENWGKRSFEDRSAWFVNIVVIMFLFWLAYALISFLWVVNKQLWLRAIFLLFFGIINAIGMVVLIDSRKWFDLLAWTITIAAAIVTILAWFEILTGNYAVFAGKAPGSYSYDFFRFFRLVELWFGNPNNLSFVLAISLGFIYHIWAIHPDNGVRVFCGLLMAAIISVVFQASSRSTLLALMIGFAAVFILQLVYAIRFKKTFLKTLTLLLAIIVLVPVFRAPLNKQSIVTSSLDTLSFVQKTVNNVTALFRGSKSGKGTADQLLINTRQGGIDGGSPVAGGDAGLLSEISNTTTNQIVASSDLTEGSLDASKNITKSDLTRIDLLKKGIDLLVESKGFGVGAGNLEFLADAEKLPNIHNYWAEILVVYGVPVFLPYILVILWVFFGLFRSIIHNKDKNQFQFASNILLILILFIISSIGPSSLFNIEIHWIFLGLIMAGYHLLYANNMTKAYTDMEEKTN